MKFAMNGTLYRGSKPVMWSVVEKTALAEAEVEYQEDHEPHDLREVSRAAGRTLMFLNGGGGKPTPGIASSDKVKLLEGASVVIWTTTPWTIPGNRAIAFSPDIAYGLYEVTDAPATIGPSPAISSFSPMRLRRTFAPLRASMPGAAPPMSIRAD